MTDRFAGFSEYELAQMGDVFDDKTFIDNLLKEINAEIIAPLLNDVRPEKTTVKAIRSKIKNYLKG